MKNDNYFVYVLEGGATIIDTEVKPYKCIGVRASFDKATELVDEFTLPFSQVDWNIERSKANKLIRQLQNV